MELLKYPIWFMSMLSCFSVSISSAVETDQFLAWKASLKDSKIIVNKYLNENAQHIIAEANKGKKKVSCAELVSLINKPLTGGVFFSTIEELLLNDPNIERLPTTKSRDEIISQTIYRDVWAFRLNIFGKTIRVNGVNIGVDKMGHFLHEGESYYHSFKKSLSEGLNVLQALEKMLKLGINQEKTYFGYWVSGVFSHADLEANFQGFQYHFDFCEGPSPKLQKTEGQWVLTRPIEIEQYVNADWDETFNLSHYNVSRWLSVKNALATYCSERNSPKVQQLFSDYRKRFPTPSLSKQYIDYLFSQQKLPDPKSTSLESICKD